jgi:hypothetical protein
MAQVVERLPSLNSISNTEKKKKPNKKKTKPNFMESRW